MADFINIPHLESFACEAMACEFVFHIQAGDSKKSRQATQEASEYLEKLEGLLSLYVESSDTTRINRAKAGEMIRISKECLDCLLLAFEASALFSGKYHPFLGLDSLKAKNQIGSLQHLPSASDGGPEAGDEPVIALDRDNQVVKKIREGPLLDLGGIGKGFALDKLGAVFEDWNIDRVLLESGGSAYLALGVPEELSGWPLNIGHENHATEIHLSQNQALASSGFAFQDSHIIDPASLSEAKTRWVRSYAFADSGALADAASTAAILMSEEELKSIATEESGIKFTLFDGEKEPVRFGIEI